MELFYQELPDRCRTLSICFGGAMVAKMVISTYERPLKPIFRTLFFWGGTPQHGAFGLPVKPAKRSILILTTVGLEWPPGRGRTWAQVPPAPIYVAMKGWRRRLPCYSLRSLKQWPLPKLFLWPREVFGIESSEARKASAPGLGRPCQADAGHSSPRPSTAKGPDESDFF